jgi:hypothetical protein
MECIVGVEIVPNDELTLVPDGPATKVEFGIFS